MDTVVAFVYFDYKDQERQTGPNIAANLLKQILTKVHEIPDDILKSSGTLHRSRSVDEWAQLIAKCIPQFRSVFVILDGLDECEDRRTERQILTLAQFLQTKGIKLLITSRYKDVPLGLVTEILFFEARNSDIKTYVETELATLELEPATQDRVVATIVREAQTMFLLATLQVDHVSQIPVALIASALNKLPRNLDSALDEVMQRIRSKGEEVQELVFKALAWVLYATRPLTVLEMLEAVSVEEWSEKRSVLLTEHDLVQSCSGLIFIEAKNGTVRFLHQGVQDYILRRLLSLPLPTNIWLTKICLTYVGFKDFEGGPIKDNNITAYRLRHLDFPFLNYAVCNWAYHLKGGGESDPAIRQRILDLCQCPTKLEALLQTRHAIVVGDMTQHVDNYPRSSSFLHLVSGEGLTSLAIWYLFQNKEKRKLLLENTDSYGRTPLHEASLKGQMATPLHRAAEAGQTEVIKTLISCGANLFALDQYQNNSLHRAVISSETDAVQYILKEMFDRLKTTGFVEIGLEHRLVGRDWTLLHQAAGLGYEEGVEWLLKAGADPRVKDKWGDTPLHRAAVWGHVGPVQKILSLTSMTPNDRTGRGHTPLHFAAMYGHQETVEALLYRFGANPTIRDFLGFTALHWAAAAGQTSVVKLLLPLTELFLPAEFAPSPFHLASWANFPLVRKAILEFYSLPSDESLSQIRGVRTVAMFNLLESGAQTVEANLKATDQADLEPELQQHKLSMLLKFWAGIEMERKREGAARCWLDLDMVYSRDASQITGPQHVQICDHCGVQPIVGDRYRCNSCTLMPWFDLCSKCYNRLSHVSHPHASYGFYKVPSHWPLLSLEVLLGNLTEGYEGYES